MPALSQAEWNAALAELRRLALRVEVARQGFEKIRLAPGKTAAESEAQSLSADLAEVRVLGTLERLDGPTREAIVDAAIEDESLRPAVRELFLAMQRSRRLRDALSTVHPFSFAPAPVVVPSRTTRVAVAQLAVHPAAVLDGWSFLDDHRGNHRSPSDPLGYDLPLRDALGDKLPALRARIRDTYCAQWRTKVEAILASCRAWAVRLLVLPEYAVPWQELEWLAAEAGDLVVVAGTHTVTPEAKRSGVYQRLGVPADQVRYHEALSLVLHGGYALGSQAKLHPATPELRSLKHGQRWSPIELPDGLPGPMGVLICLDFLISVGGVTPTEGAASALPEASSLLRSRFLAVPSLTPFHSVEEFSLKAWESAERYKRPVLYANVAAVGSSKLGGGSSIFVDEDREHDLEHFPLRVGRMGVHDEGVIVADVDLGYVRAHGRSTPYEQHRPVIPFAAASLLYTRHPALAQYRDWLASLTELLTHDDDDAFDAMVEKVREGTSLLRDVIVLSGREMRARRLRELLDGPERVQGMEGMRQALREIPLPASVLPLDKLQAAMAQGAANSIDLWRKEIGGLDALLEAYRADAKGVTALSELEWSEEGRAAVAAAVAAVEVWREPDPPPVVVERVVEVVRAPEGIDPRGIPDFSVPDLSVIFIDTAEPSFSTTVSVSVRSRGEDSAHDQRARWRAGDADDGMWLPALRDHFDLELLLRAQGIAGYRVALLVCPSTRAHSAAILLRGELGIEVHTTYREGPLHDAVVALVRALDARGFGPTRLVSWTPTLSGEAIRALRERFQQGGAVVAELLHDKLREVDGHFVEPDVLNGDVLQPSLTALDEWLASTTPRCLLLGEFGTGKSTLLAAWCHQRWSEDHGPQPILCNLAGAGADADPWRLLLDASRCADTPENRAALRVLLRRGHLFACFDGFDEMATRVDAATLPARLRGLLDLAEASGRVLVSSRDHYFRSEGALQEVLGATGPTVRLSVQLFSKEKVDALVHQVRNDDAEAALAKIEATYDLKDLVERPILLAMVLKTLDDFQPGSRVARADIYERYLTRWLENTHTEGERCLDDAQKVAFAESLAEQLWRTGQTACTWDELRQSVRERLLPQLKDDDAPAHALNEVAGSAFFVRDGEDRYRFAHKSFLEYFLARALVRTIPGRVAEALRTKPLTQEVSSFVGEILRLDGEPTQHRVIHELHRWITEGRADKDTLAESADAAANTLRLLCGLARWSSSTEGWFTERMDLREIELRREDLSGARLTRARLRGARLIACTMEGTRLDDAVLDGAVLDDARLRDTDLSRASLRDASLVGVGATRVQLEGSDLCGARLRQSVWWECAWGGGGVDGADVTACVAPGSPWSPEKAVPWDELTVARVDRPKSAVSSVGFSPDGQTVVTDSSDGTVRWWSVSGGGLRQIRWESESLVAPMAVSTDGQMFAIGSNDGVVQLLLTADDELRQPMRVHDAAVSSVSFSPDGHTLVSGSSDGTVRLVSVGDGVLSEVLQGHEDEVTSVAFSPDGLTVVSGSKDGTVRLWSVLDGVRREVLRGHDGEVTSVAFLPDGLTVVSGSTDGTVRLWSLVDGVSCKILQGHDGEVTSVAFSPDGLTVVSGSEDGTTRLWSVADGGLRETLLRHEGWLDPVGFSPDGQMVVSGSHDGTVRLWSLAEGWLCRTLWADDHAVLSAEFSPVGQMVACGSSDGKVRLWSVADGGLHLTLQGNNRAWVRAVRFSPDGEMVAIGDDDCVVRLWSVADGRLRQTLRGQMGWGGVVGFSPDGQIVVSAAYDGTVRLWSVENGELHQTLRVDENWVNSVGFSPDGRTMVCGADDGTVRLWAVLGGELLHTLRANDSTVTSVRFSPDGHTVVSGSVDGAVRLWSVTDGLLRQTMQGHCGAVTSVMFSPDGYIVVSGSTDGTVRLWHDTERACLISFPEGEVVSTPAGYAIHTNDPDLMLAWRNPRSPECTFYLPIEPLRELFHQPERVARYLQGDPAVGTFAEFAASLGWANASTWDGTHTVLPARTPSPPAAPFSPGPAVAPEHLIGRDTDLAALTAMLTARTSVALVGPRRSGKSSLLAALITRLREDHEVRSVSLEGARALNSRDDLAKLLAPELASSSTPADALLDLSWSRPPVFVIDEMAHLQKLPPAELSWLRALSQRVGPVVLAGSRQDWTLITRHAAREAGASFGNDLSPYELGPLPLEDATAWLRAPRPDAAPLPDTVVRRVIAQCGTWPFYLQVMGQTLVSAVRRGDHAPLQSEAAFLDLYERALLLDRTPMFEGRWNELTLPVRTLLHEHAETPRPRYDTLDDELQIALNECGLCNVRGRWLEDGPFFEWVRVQRRALGYKLKAQRAAN
jgi:WD40 repeat protein/predicted amidohydrolase